MIYPSQPVQIFILIHAGNTFVSIVRQREQVNCTFYHQNSQYNN